MERHGRNLKKRKFPGIMKTKDLRSAIELLQKEEGQIAQTDGQVDPIAELSGVYRHIGAGGTVMRPTQLGPALMFNAIKGHPGSRVLIGLFASRKRVSALLGTTPEKVGRVLTDALERPIPPITVPSSEAPCQEEVHRASDPGFDLRKLMPIPTNTPEDAGPYVTLGHCYASDPETGESDITIHRLCVQGPTEITMFFTPGARHLEIFRKKAEEAGKPLPISISIGIDPAISIATCFEPPTTPLGYDELLVAGGLRGEAVDLVKCVSIEEKAIAHAEYVIEGELVPGLRMDEDHNTKSGKAMPEFPGYTGPAARDVPVIRVTALTHRRNPIMQTCIGPSEEHVNLVGIPTEASIMQAVDRAMPGRLLNVYAHPSGGGKYLAVMQFKKSQSSDEGRQRQAALIALSAYSELKHVILVDEDVDPFDTNDVLWALNTRYQGDVDTVFIPGIRCHPLDPSESPAYNPLIRDTGVSCKTVFDCTVPWHLKERFQRARFMEPDMSRFPIRPL